ncbi:hypothetical protein FA13DRAFT_1720645 [Coprinellus micaceus]|uniref:F-box domain-containing protein n=1 Tax=Coprinellus micaceus TaxID=71717 RepID=A0A4Y7S969_COPMI|nr:hypothetical protein FA13DRAFT_1720645 [Coprinellus micaceus]
MIFDILRFIFDEGIGHGSGPYSILEDGTPLTTRRRFFACSIVRVNRAFNEVGTKMLWTRVNVETAEDLKYLGLAASCNPSLGAMTKRLEIGIHGPVLSPLLERILQYMDGLDTFWYWIVAEEPSSFHRWPWMDLTHADVVVTSLNKFCPKLRNIVLETQNRLSPTAQCVFELLKVQKNLKVLHLDSITLRCDVRDGYYDPCIPYIPPSFQAESLRVMSLGIQGDWEDWDGKTDAVGEFWRRFAVAAFPRLESLYFPSFNPNLLPFVRSQSTGIRHLQITSFNRHFYSDPFEPTRTHILDIATDVVHLTWRLDIPHGTGVKRLKTWKPLPTHHASLQRITILPDSYSCRRSRDLTRLLERTLKGILVADLPKLRVVEIEDTIAMREDVVSSRRISRLLKELRDKGMGGVTVDILDTGASGQGLEAPL